MAEGTRLGEHDSPGVATVQVLRGRARLTAGDQHWDLAPGDHVLIPDRRHQVESLEDAVILLTVAADAPPATAG